MTASTRDGRSSGRSRGSKPIGLTTDGRKDKYLRGVEESADLAIPTQQPAAQPPAPAQKDPAEVEACLKDQDRLLEEIKAQYPMPQDRIDRFERARKDAAAKLA